MEIARRSNGNTVRYPSKAAAALRTRPGLDTAERFLDTAERFIEDCPTNPWIRPERATVVDRRERSLASRALGISLGMSLVSSVVVLVLWIQF